MLTRDFHQDLIQPELNVSPECVERFRLISSVRAGLDFCDNHAVLLRDEAGDDALIGSARVEKADLVIAEEEGAVLCYDCYCGPFAYISELYEMLLKEAVAYR